MFETPILLIVFNRPEETKKVFAEIRKLAPAHLYIAADGPREDRLGEKQLCETVQAILDDINWKCSVKRMYRKKNVGCGVAVSEAITWFFENVEQGIILEDDCVPHQSFFLYCAQLLDKYKSDERIISIGGTNLGYHLPDDSSYAFSRFMNMWGWASWKRSAKLVDYKMHSWNHLPSKTLFLQKKLSDRTLVPDINWINYWGYYFNITAAGKANTWDYQWIFAQLCYDKLSVFPATNLIHNIGFSNNATHTHEVTHPLAALSISTMDFPLVHPAQVAFDKTYEREYIKKIWFQYKNESIYVHLKRYLLRNKFIKSAINSFK